MTIHFLCPIKIAKTESLVQEFYRWNDRRMKLYLKKLSLKQIYSSLLSTERSRKTLWEQNKILFAERAMSFLKDNLSIKDPKLLIAAVML